MNLKISSCIVQGRNTVIIDSQEIVISTSDDGLQLLGDMYYQGFEQIILHEHNLSPQFFKLKNGMAGEILQKFANYRMTLIIIGNFSNIKSESLNAFIVESNTRNTVNFVGSMDELINK